MPVHLTAPTLRRPRHPAPTLVVKLLAMVAIAMGALALENTAYDSVAGSAQEVAGP